MPIMNTVIKGSGGSSGKYQLYQRITDDSNNDIGIVYGFHTDGNGNEYALVALNAEHRLDDNGAFLSANVWVPNVTAYENDRSSLPARFSATETATSNCDAILAFAAQNNYTSTGISFCRSKSFTIGGTTYYGQLPTLVELYKMVAEYKNIEANDPTVSANPTLSLFSLVNLNSSTPVGANDGAWPYSQNWYLYGAAPYCDSKTTGWGCAPILELPNS